MDFRNYFFELKVKYRNKITLPYIKIPTVITMGTNPL